MNKPRLLFVEDDPDQILIYQSKFEMEGLVLIVAMNSKEAMRFALNENPKLILLDLLLRDENGLDILAELKKNPKTKDIPVIVFTNFDTKEAQEKAAALGAIQYIVKARVTPSEIAAIVKKVLGIN